MILTLLATEDSRLRLASSDVTEADLASLETQSLIDDMIATMRAQKNGVGIAAAQIGVNKRIIIVDHDGKGEHVYVNARLSDSSKQMVESEEGCFSVPGTWGLVKRHKKIHFKALDRQGKKINRKSSGFEAIVLQHEIDHTDGILFIDHDVEITRRLQM